MTLEGKHFERKQVWVPSRKHKTALHHNNSKQQHLCSIDCDSDNVLNSSRISHKILRNNLCDRYYYHPHFTDGKTEAMDLPMAQGEASSS